MGETATTRIFASGDARDRELLRASAARPSMWKTYLMVASWLTPSGGVIVRSVSTRIVFSPRIIAERSALKSRKVKPVPSMFVVVPLRQADVAADHLAAGPGRTAAARCRGPMIGELRIDGIGHELAVRLFSYIFGYA